MKATIELRKNGWHTTLELGDGGLNEVRNDALRHADVVVLDGERYRPRCDGYGRDIILERI